MKEGILAIWLIIQGVIDWKFKKIPVGLSILGAGIGLAFCVLQDREMGNLLVACLPGVILLFFSKITKEVLGYGDGMVFLVMGFYLSIEKVISIGLLSFVMAGIAALILLVFFHKGRSYRMPFLPYLSSVYVFDFLLREGGV